MNADQQQQAQAATPDDTEDQDLQKLLNPDSDADDSEYDDALLTDEERAALRDEDEDAAQAADDDADDDDAAAQADQAAQDQQAQPAPAQLTPPDGLLLGDELKAKLSEFATERDSLFEQYEDGELSLDDLKAKQAEIDEASISLRTEAAKFEGIQQHQYEQEVASWTKTIEDYRTEYPEVFEPGVVEQFDTLVRTMGSSPQFASKSDRELLELAHDAVVPIAKAFNIDLAPRNGKAQDTTKETPKPADPKPDAAKEEGETNHPLPQTLAKIPASDISTARDGRFGVLDEIIESGDPDKIDTAMSRLTPEEREAWAASA